MKSRHTIFNQKWGEWSTLIYYFQSRVGQSKLNTLFLESVASVTEFQSGSINATFIMTYKAFRYFQSKYRAHININELLLNKIASTMLEKLDKYEQLLCSGVATLAQALDPRFSNEIIVDSEISYRYVILSSPECSSQIKNSIKNGGK